MSTIISFNDFRTSVKNHQPLQKKINPAAQQVISSHDSIEINNQFNNAKRQNGLIEKLADKIKGAVGFGHNSKKIQELIEKENDKDKIKKEIKAYRSSQENTAQGVSDIFSSIASIFTFFKVKELYQENIAKFLTINNIKISKYVKRSENNANFKKLINFTEKNINKKATAVIIATIPAMIIGSFVKKNILKLNRITTQQYKPDTSNLSDKEEIKLAKKQAKKQRKNANLRNSLTGSINGLSATLLALGPIGTVPYLAINSLSRYFIGNTEDKKEKSIKSYIENLKTSPILNIATAGIIAIPAAIKSQSSIVFEKSLNTAIEKLKSQTLQNFSVDKTTYERLSQMLLDVPEVEKIIYDSSLSNAQKIEQLSNTNILALKFIQIESNDSSLAKALKTDCPRTYTDDEIAEKLKAAFGSKYSNPKYSSAGTIAETYIVQDAQKNEFCIKILKKGIDANKIQTDIQNYRKFIEQQTTGEEQTYMLRMFDNIAKGVLAEVDFENERKAALALKKVTKKAKIVAPVEVCKDIYVMEKADGYCLQTIMEYLNGTADKKTIEALSNIGEITDKEAKKLIQAYQDVYVEQFSQVNKKGKIIHGDIHPGNIFVDIEALRRGDKKFITLIDTGNTVEQTQEMAIKFMNLTKYIKNGDVENITNFVLEGAKLPSDMTYEQAFEKISNELKKLFFESEIYKFKGSPQITNDNLLIITDSIMRDLNIMPSDTQGALLKAKKAADQSLKEFSYAFISAIENKIDSIVEGSTNKAQKGLLLFKESTQVFNTLLTELPKKEKIQQLKNLIQLSPIQRAQTRASKTAPKKNSVEYLTYKLKQGKNHMSDL